MGELDPAFIQPTEHRPKLAVVEANGIPLIDLSVINHGVPLQLRQNLEIAARKFFAMPKEEKQKVRRDEVNPTGYYDAEHTKNIRDWKEVFDLFVQNPTIFPVSHEPDDNELKEYTNKWPENPPELR
ncbi:unnamed protein product [Ilex paraguariensis]|uniref:Non-haem dioxygenase N-terminal domain-containing protein n=1 Tax=Ilex paraguariensis TaxID=185542 RepID=A0ABC8UFH1_9AQUA